MDGCPGGKIPMKSSVFEGFVNILLGWSEPILSAKVADFQMWDKILQDDLLIKVGHLTIFLLATCDTWALCISNNSFNCYSPLDNEFMLCMYICVACHNKGDI